MKISYSLLTHNETDSLLKLIEFLVKHKDEKDEIVILDDFSDNEKTKEILDTMCSINEIKFEQRHLLKEEFTRIMLPTYKEGSRGNPLGKAEAARRMKVLYERVVKRIAKTHDFYRTYKPSNMSSIKVLKYKLGEWHQPTLR